MGKATRRGYSGLTVNEVTPDPMEKRGTSWPFALSVLALLLSLIFAELLLPGLDIYEGHRLFCYSALLAIFTVRWRIAVVHCEQGSSWKYYLGLILVAPLIADRFVYWATTRS
jgi:hypothetical protein